MNVFYPESRDSNIKPLLYNQGIFPINDIGKTADPVSNKNDYFSFNRSIHYTLADYNRLNQKQHVTLTDLHSILKNNWQSSDYSSISQDNKFYVRGLLMLAKYYKNPQDKGLESIVINKVLTTKLSKNRIILARLDKVYEKEDGSIELIDYKTGRVITHENQFKIDFRIAVYLVLMYEQLYFYPDYISYYYLHHNRKISRHISPSDIQYAYSILKRSSLGEF